MGRAEKRAEERKRWWEKQRARMERDKKRRSELRRLRAVFLLKVKTLEERQAERAAALAELDKRIAE